MKEFIGLLIFAIITITSISLYIKKTIKFPFATFLLGFGLITGLCVANYNSIEKIKYKDFEFETLKKEVQTTGKTIIKVENEIANLKEMIHQQYAAFKTEKFEKGDMGKRIMVYKNPLNPEKDSIIVFELQMIPEISSIQLSDRYGMQAPPYSLTIESNVIFVIKSYTTLDRILNNNEDYYSVKYMPDFNSDKMLLSAENAEISVEGGKIKYSFKYKQN